jgi:hypothetical protein
LLSTSLVCVHVAPASCDCATYGSPPVGPLNDTNTCWPLSLIAITGLSFQLTLPYVLTGADQWPPWSVDFVNITLKPFM